MKSTVSGVFEVLNSKVLKCYKQNCCLPVSAQLAVSAAETANRAEPGKLQFWSWPSEIFNLRSSNTPETVECRLHATLILNLVKPLVHTRLFFNSLDVGPSNIWMMPWGFWMARRFFIKCFLSVFGLCIGFSFQASETVGFFVKTNLDQFYSRAKPEI